MINVNIDKKVVKKMSKKEREKLNADPISGEIGAHPIGTGIGATSGALGGAAIGIVGGPVGLAIGGTIGALVGGLAGKNIAEGINPTAEDIYWDKTYSSHLYYKHTYCIYDDIDNDRDYHDAYLLGYNSRGNYPYETSFEEVEPDLKAKWEAEKQGSFLKWEDAKYAVKDAWDRVSN